MASAPTLPPSSGVNINDTLGAGFLGVIFASILYGMTCVQCYSFFKRYKGGSAALKISIWVLWFLNTAHMVFVVDLAYMIFITGFGNTLTFTELPVPWSLGAAVFATNVINALVSFWLGYPVWVLSKRNRLVITPLVVIDVVAFGFGTASSIELWSRWTFPYFASHHWVYFTSALLYASSDLGIALVLCWYLSHQRDGLHRRTYTIVNTLMVYAINTGLLTSFVGTAAVVLAAVRPNDLIFLALYLTLSELYTNSLLASLHARKRLRKKINDVAASTGRTISPSMVFATATAVERDEDATAVNTFALDLSQTVVA